MKQYAPLYDAEELSSLATWPIRLGDDVSIYRYFAAQLTTSKSEPLSSGFSAPRYTITVILGDCTPSYHKIIANVT